MSTIHALFTCDTRYNAYIIIWVFIVSVSLHRNISMKYGYL